MQTLTLPAHVDSLPKAIDFIGVALDARHCPSAVRMQFELSLEELFVNVCHYAYPESTPEDERLVQVAWEHDESSGLFTFELSDRGVVFDPLVKAKPDLDQGVDERPIGGLGSFLVRKYADTFSYERKDGANIVRFSKRW